ncbi:FecR family protein [Telluribacter sp. SYSU D00476]|uniref:FecR family protein n=1 Tax=Telluribacter sp. SYSU D00476 TaxID=2811430 RepID=UPI001FF1BFA2|nr:FecR domain-containing protein [Telluribacter sp. SYSU D00476]
MSQLPDNFEDLLLHTDFIRWVKDPASDADGTWAAWLAQAPEQRGEVILKARLVLRSLPPEEELSHTEVQALWQGALDRRQEREISGTKTWHPQTSLTPWYRIAAILVLTVGLGLLSWYFLTFNPTELQTTYGELRTEQLPDGSQVTLNSHSQLSYQTDWAGNREVWLKGEAYFRVSKKQIAGTPATFTVHTEGLDVQVLGTQFNVHNRRDQVRVLLTEGKVELQKNGGDKERMILKPGELAELPKSGKALRKQQVDPARHLAWMEKVLVFEQATLRDIADALEDQFGHKVVIADPSLARLTFTGNMLADNEQLVLDTIAKALGVKITRNGEQVIVQRP